MNTEEYTAQIEQQLEELQEKLAVAEFQMARWVAWSKDDPDRRQALVLGNGRHPIVLAEIIRVTDEGTYWAQVLTSRFDDSKVVHEMREGGSNFTDINAAQLWCEERVFVNDIE
jgi:hypothetical protein